MTDDPVEPIADVVFPDEPGDFLLSKSTETTILGVNGSWTKPEGAQSVAVVVLGQGGGGGSGRRGAAGSARSGGGGGSGGGWSWMTFPAVDLPDTVQVYLNDPGSGGGGVVGTTITDSFNRANSTTTLGSADTGQSWLILGTSGNAWGISGSQAYNAGDSSGSIALQVLGSADMSASVTIAVKSSSAANLLIRSNSDGSQYIFYNSGLATVSRYGYGPQPTLTYAAGKSSSDLATVAGDTIALSALGATVTVSKNGTTICTFTDTAAGTYAGMACNSATPRFDNFAASTPSTPAPGAPGTGGPAVTTDNTNGVDGIAGSDTRFGSYLVAQGGRPGLGGTALAGTAATGPLGTLAVAGAGGVSSTAGGAGGSGGSAAGGSGAGGGGGLSTGNVGSVGGPSGFPLLLSPSGTFQAARGGGQSGNSVSPNGEAGTLLATELPLPGVGGGGGQAQTAAAGGSGGIGGDYGAPGGGGGASTNGYASGNGGDGGRGIAVITTYF